MARRTLDSFGLDRWLLALAFFAGALGVVALKLAEMPQWAPALYAGGVIVAYAGLTWFLRSARLEPEQIGDNAYYLGFVLTLCSLAYTLWALGAVEAEAAFIAEVVSGFGVALTSTVVGVAVRVFLMQFRIDLVAREREAQLALAEGMSAFRSELAEVIRGTRFLGVEIRQTLAQHHKELAEQDMARSKEATDRMMASFEAAMDRFADRAAAMNDVLATRAEGTVAAASGRLATLADRQDQAGQAFEARMEDASARAAAAAEARLEAVIARFEAAANRSSATLAASTAAIGQAALGELRAHRAEIRAEIRAALTLTKAANDAPQVRADDG
ncbi:hypothetical protein JANAI62_00650 [Jannaschia pagri]|uniref:Uncharacterized protein n=1 Tax=Jannaschia pagri TaxID=2829797 RepID=A0ABQ4NG93_9RHOB|nr:MULTISPECIES: hypothetical protein [unclassified Jannaschia]GIT90453.1 hypothetical protein JANAI61_09110 [Jannaschia sp. AI_61]GIT93442.1 hypothetical protein JANAI62_00650 [Jannaschia sp. AI_62]